MKNCPNVMIIGDTTRRSNWGCRATSSALSKLVSDRSNLKCKIDMLSISLSSNTSRNVIQKLTSRVSFADYFSRLINPSYLQGCLRNLSLANFDRYAEFLASDKIFPEFNSIVSDVDWVLINGEGSIIQNRAFGKISLLAGYVAKRFHGKSVAIVNHSCDTTALGMREIVNKTYPFFDKVVFREPYSYNQNISFCKNAATSLSVDAAFSLKPHSFALHQNLVNRKDYFSFYPDSCILDTSKPYICIGGSAAFRAESSKFKDIYNAYNELCSKLIKYCQVCLTASSIPDDLIFKPLAKSLNLPYLGVQTPMPQALDVLANSSLYIGGRWHPGILSLLGGTPLILFSSNTSHKTNGLLELAGLDDQDQLNALKLHGRIDYIVDRAQKLIANSALSQSISNNVAIYRELVLRNVDFLE